MEILDNGAFSDTHAKQRISQGRWVLDQGLLGAMAQLLRLQGGPPAQNLPSVIDLGAGIGLYSSQLNAIAASRIATAIDAIPEIESLSNGQVQHGDLTDPTLRERLPICDWSISLEVAEHIPVRATEQFVRNVTALARNGIIISWAAPGQPGEGHVNCRSQEDVRKLFAAYGWAESAYESDMLRHNADVSWFQRNVMVFRRLSPKIFCIGLPKTGAETLSEALGILGYRIADWPHDPATQHQLRSGDYRLSLLEANKCDGISDLQAAMFFREYFHCWPGAKFLLTNRNVDDHLRAIQKHFRQSDPLPSDSFALWLRTASWGTGIFEWNRFRRVYLEHQQQVQDWFAEHQASDRLLTLPLLEQDGSTNWEQLCSFLRHDVPDVQFPG